MEGYEENESFYGKSMSQVLSSMSKLLLIGWLRGKPNEKLGHLDVSSVIDFYKPRSCAGHDKLGYKNFVVALKAILFENPSRRMIKRVCEEFFNDDGNFYLAKAPKIPASLNGGILAI
jgi:hypothetical protein